MSSKPKAAYIDRDGLIIEVRNCVRRIAYFVLLSGVVEDLTLSQNVGYLHIVVINQSGFARRYFDQATIYRLDDHLFAQLAEHGLPLYALSCILTILITALKLSP